MAFFAQSLTEILPAVSQLSASRDLFYADEQVWVARAPGRLDVMGGNVDYTGGLVLQGLLQEAVWACVQRRNDRRIRICNPGASDFGWKTDFEVDLPQVQDFQILREISSQSETTRWTGYVLGALHRLITEHGWGSWGGANIFISSNLPPNKGVSSSAALEVAVLKAAAAAGRTDLRGVPLATEGQWVENMAVGAACGIMDQAAIVLGRKNHLLPILCQPCQPLAPIEVPEGLCLWGIDSMAARSTKSPAYEIARAAAFMGYKLICLRENLPVAPDEHSPIPRWTDARWHGYLSNLSALDFHRSYESWLPESMAGSEFLTQSAEHADPFTIVQPTYEYPIRAAVRYAVEENARVQNLHSLFEASANGISPYDLERAGELFHQSHVAYRECGLGSEACDELVALMLHHGLPGAKMTGGGGGGVVAVLGRFEDRAKVFRIAKEYGIQRGTQPHIFEGSSDGVDAFGAYPFPSSCWQGKS